MGIRPIRKKALVVRCFDPRIEEEVEQYVEQDLHLARRDYIEMSLPGSIASAGAMVAVHLPEQFEVFCNYMIRVSLKVLMKYSDPDGLPLRVVFIVHEGCAGHGEVEERIMRRAAERGDEARHCHLGEDLNHAIAVTRRIALEESAEVTLEAHVVRMDGDFVTRIEPFVLEAGDVAVR